MASLSKDKGKTGVTRRVLFKAADGSRKAIHLGDVTAKQANTILAHVDQLERCLIDGSAPPTQTAAWLAEIGDGLRAKFAWHGLVSTKVDAKVLTLGELITAFKSRPGWQSNKPRTRDNKERAFAFALTHFGDDRPINAITAAAAGDFYAWLRLPKASSGAGQGAATANLIASCVFTLFNFALDAELLARNPFKALPRAARKGNNANVGVADSLTVIAAMQGSEEKLLFALARWGGLRTPSEPKGLRWCDVDRERERILIHSPKTERHEGRETRWIPIFPELRPLIQARFDDAEPGEDYVLPSMRFAITTAATRILRAALRRAGVEPWPRLWHSLRATRQSELTERFPAHVVAGWLGNSVAVANKHYLMTTDDHFAAAARIT
ncbi:MAG: site-specific integrase, partial [Pirellulales bacterium]|nr:site-specific integrase [Pirellulales bacterium]